MLYFLGAVSVLLTAIGYATKRMSITISSAFAWMITGINSYGYSSITWDMFYILFWFCIAMTLGVSVEAVTMRFSSSNEEEHEQKTTKQHDSTEYKPSHIDQLRARHGLSPSIIRERNKRNRESGW